LNGEVIFIRLVDVGRKINLQKAINIIHGVPDKVIIKKRDTPKYVDFPEPIKLEIIQQVSTTSSFIKEVNLLVKLYEDGVISLTARLKFTNIQLRELSTIKKIRFYVENKEYNINQFLKFHETLIFNQIVECIDELGYNFGISDTEKYTIYCVTEKFENPQSFIKENQTFIANLLIGENPDLKLNEYQIKRTLENSFSYLQNDFVIFDFDRALIIDPTEDYSDLLQIIEIANYQLLELRILDKLLDRRLSLAESDISKIYYMSGTLWRRLGKRVGNLLRLRYDLTYLLENVENVSKLIGDFYLAQLYTRLAELFQLKEWSRSIRHRIDTIGDIYNIAQTNLNEKFLLYMEILLTFIFVIEFVFLILGYFK
jgi:sulfur relay (sulfurtransferase) DsrF/TusC family protein